MTKRTGISGDKVMTPLEELAKRLYESAFDPEVSPLEDSGYKEEIMEMAKTVQILCLEARLDEVELERLTNGHSTNNKIRKTELMEQITELRKEAK